MYDPDLAIDGAAGELNVAKILGHDDDFVLAVRGGAFPLEPGDDNFPSRSFNKRNFRDQYIFRARSRSARISLAASRRGWRAPSTISPIPRPRLRPVRRVHARCREH